MYNPLRLQFSCMMERGKINYDLQLRGSVVVIDGDSGTGKSLLSKAVATNSAQGKLKGKVYSTIETGQLTVEELKLFKDKIIVVDNADLLVPANVLEYMMTDKNNHYIIFRRRCHDTNLSPNYYAELTFDENKNLFTLKYFTSAKGWY